MCLQRLATEQKTKEENERREKERLEKAKRDEEDRAERKKVSSRQYRGVWVPYLCDEDFFLVLVFTVVKFQSTAPHGAAV